MQSFNRASTELEQSLNRAWTELEQSLNRAWVRVYPRKTESILKYPPIPVVCLFLSSSKSGIPIKAVRNSRIVSWVSGSAWGCAFLPQDFHFRFREWSLNKAYSNLPISNSFQQLFNSLKESCTNYKDRYKQRKSIVLLKFLL